MSLHVNSGVVGTAQMGTESLRARFGLSTDPAEHAGAGLSPLFERLKLMWLMGIFVLLPLDFFKLPLNINLVDIWMLMGLSVVWAFFRHEIKFVSLSYIIALWVVLLASFISIVAAPSPRNGFIVLLKEIYIFVWFLTIAGVLATLSARDLRRVLIAWSAAVFMHGLVLIAQFLSPEFWQFTVGLSGRVKEFEIYRPSGLFVNANAAATFQLLGFVPLMLVSRSPRVAVILGVLLLPTMLATGSMGAAISLTTGFVVAMATLSLGGHLMRVISVGMQLLLAILLFAGLLSFVVSHNQRYRHHFERIFLARAERSSDSRFSLWERGIEVFLEQGVFLWGVGPDNFRVVDGEDHQLHNDFMAFLVERGLLGILGLVLFVVVALSRSAYMTLFYLKHPSRAGPAGIIFLAAIFAALVASLTHQVFHVHELWLVLALQEAMFFNMKMSSRAGV